MKLELKDFMSEEEISSLCTEISGWYRLEKLHYFWLLTERYMSNVRFMLRVPENGRDYSCIYLAFKAHFGF